MVTLNYLKTIENKIIKKPKDDIECIKFIMYFIHPFLDNKLNIFTANDIFDFFYDLSLRDKYLVIHHIKRKVNDGLVEEIINDIINYIIKKNATK
jgi:hypothetical protein